MSAPATTSARSPYDSCAACSPSSGLPPVPASCINKTYQHACCYAELASGSGAQFEAAHCALLFYVPATPDGCTCLQVACAASAPRPRVISPPSCSLFVDSEFSSACASVLTAQNSTPWRQNRDPQSRLPAITSCSIRPACMAPCMPWMARDLPVDIEEALASAYIPSLGMRSCSAAGSRAALLNAHLQAAADHAVDSIASTTAHAHNLDACIAS